MSSMICDKRPVLLLGVILHHSNTWEVSGNNEPAACAIDCRNCEYFPCDSKCHDRCKGTVCPGYPCKQGCKQSWYGDNCQHRCSFCLYGCEQDNGRCIDLSPWPQDTDDHRDEDEDVDYSSTKISSKSGMALKMCATVLCLAVILFVVATCCRRQEMPVSVNVTGNTNSAGDYIDNDMSSDNSSLHQRRDSGTSDDQILDQCSGHRAGRTETEGSEDCIIHVVVEQTAPMLDPSGMDEYQSPSPPLDPPLPLLPPVPQSDPPPPPPVPISDPPPSYSSLFPQN